MPPSTNVKTTGLLKAILSIDDEQEPRTFIGMMKVSIMTAVYLFLTWTAVRTMQLLTFETAPCASARIACGGCTLQVSLHFCT
jgi:hypothetical protein